MSTASAPKVMLNASFSAANGTKTTTRLTSVISQLLTATEMKVPARSL